MGKRNPENISIRERYDAGRDVATMAREGWDVISRCRRCGLMMQVDLKLIAFVSGPRTMLWNRYARCRRLFCGGVVDFEARAPGMAWHERLAYDERETIRTPAWLERRASAAGSDQEAAAMCNHYKASAEWRQRTGDLSEIRIPPSWAFDFSSPRVNVQADDIYPGYIGEILMPAGERLLVAAAGNWNLMPFSQKGSYADWMKARRGCNNARGETADTGWPWKLVKANRCLIPGEAFFEWDDGPKGAKTEYRFAYPDGRPFYFGGLYSRSEPPEGPTLSYTMVTKAAGGDTASIGHPRQPVILGSQEIEAWLDPAVTVASFTERLDPVGTFTVTAAKGAKAAAA